MSNTGDPQSRRLMRAPNGEPGRLHRHTHSQLEDAFRALVQLLE
jgi:hypothetical protein